MPAWQCPYHEVVCVEDVALPVHAELEDLLQAAGAECGAAESHGLVCGMICAAGSAAKRGWLEHLLGEGNTLSAAAQAAAAERDQKFLGNPRPRRAMMFFMTSEEPPPIVSMTV